jgi:disulfide bond formation protein DsbB
MPMLETKIRPDNADAYRLGGLALLISTGIILTALGFEYLGGYAPCPLCLMQRYAFYAGIPLTFAAMALVAERARWAALIFFAVALAYLANAGLATYHAGVEWHFWPGPDTCATAQALPTTPADLLKGLESARVVRCDEATWRLFGLSFAGWNVLICLALFAICLQAAFAASARDQKI